MALTFHLRDLNPEVVKAFNQFFSRGGRVEISEGDVMDLDATAIITPANSFGIMEGGLGDCLNKISQGKLENRIRKMIQDKHAGEMPVGQAEIIKSGMDKPQFVVVAPTVRVPIRQTNTNTNTYLATRAALRTLAAYMREANENGGAKIESVALVGMGTGGAKCPPAVAAFQMYEAYCQVVLGQEPNFATIETATAHDVELRKNRF
ncbi:MAG: macro domain-containing protein [Candidatus Melainabacteria bacterium]|jgi:O-acetyl-ADP-ribose deacetylase (regulator of RNase III)|nr:macro domain-containing protein [Candidatus Melainabacteria bacterium]